VTATISGQTPQSRSSSHRSSRDPANFLLERHFRSVTLAFDVGENSGNWSFSSAETPRFVDLLSFPRLTVNFFSDEILGDFGEIGGECAAQFLELGPENPIDKATWRFDDDCLHVHPVISKGPDPVPTTERDKELSGPNVWDRESDLLQRLAAGGIPQECANAVGCSTSCGLLASRTGAGKERLNFAELLAQPRQRNSLRSWRLGPFVSPTMPSGRYSHPRSPNAARSTLGGAYHPAEP
jgi:hypothetical protein